MHLRICSTPFGDFAKTAFNLCLNLTAESRSPFLLSGYQRAPASKGALGCDIRKTSCAPCFMM
ncbi:MAG: hypothetical protein DVB28_001219 [Verrucomicrobia bacterium]|nr:MAG: hypothetical protein DVB28_001219 [Verrucomicrobiota bacterium]